MGSSERNATSRAWRGWSSRLILGSSIAIAALLASTASASALSREFFGALPQGPAPSDTALDRLQSGKVGSVRFQLFWPAIQPEPNGPFNWSGIDRQVGNLAAHNVRPNPVVFGTPDYVANDVAKPPTRSGQGRRLYKRFLRAAVDRYKPNGEYWRTVYPTQHPGVAPKPIKHWQIWIEQNSSKFFKPRPKPRQYRKLVETSSKAIHSRHNGAKVLLGGMFGTPQSPGAIPSWTFLNRLYAKRSFKRKFDGVGVNPFSPNLRGARFQMRKIRQVMNRNRDRRKGVWVLEVGAGSQKSAGGQLSKSRKGQARLLRKTYRLLVRQKRRAWRVKGVFWFALNDYPPAINDCKWCPSAGLLDVNLNPKPSWHALMRFTGGS